MPANALARTCLNQTCRSSPRAPNAQRLCPRPPRQTWAFAAVPSHPLPRINHLPCHAWLHLGEPRRASPNHNARLLHPRRPYLPLLRRGGNSKPALTDSRTDPRRTPPSDAMPPMPHRTLSPKPTMPCLTKPGPGPLWRIAPGTLDHQQSQRILNPHLAPPGPASPCQPRPGAPRSPRWPARCPPDHTFPKRAAPSPTEPRLEDCAERKPAAWPGLASPRLASPSPAMTRAETVRKSLPCPAPPTRA